MASKAESINGGIPASGGQNEDVKKPRIMVDDKVSYNTLLHLMSIKLSSTNYVIWKRQTQHVLKPQGLFGYLDGTKPCPTVPSPPVVATYATSVPGSSDAYEKAQADYDKAVASRATWLEEDQRLCSLLFASLKEEVLSEIPDCETSKDMWDAIASIYQNHSMASKAESINGGIPASGGQNEDVKKIPRYPPYSTQATELEKIINEKFSVLAPHSLNYGIICIYKVPAKHRKKNPEAYTPRLVSVGPLHYGQSQLQRMEEYKLKYLNNFLHTFRVPLGSLTEFVHAQEKLVHGCYENNYVINLIKPGKDVVKLSEVMLLDGVFILELFLKNHFRELREMGDVIFDNSWVSKDIVHDLLLLENQLPLKFISSLYESFVQGNLKKFLEGGASSAPSFFELVLHYFRDVGNTRNLELTPKSYSAQHLVEFLAILHTGPDIKHSPNAKSEQKLDGKGGKKKQRGRKRREKLEFTYCPTVEYLETAGVKFKQAKVKKYLFAVSFDEVFGDLNIPPMVINDSTEPFLRNLIAFEHTGYHYKYITSYVILLDNLIDTEKDVQILIESGIIVNQLGTNEQVADVFNSLYKEVVTDPKEFYFLDTCNALNKYSKNCWHAIISWCANAAAVLRRDYFNTPWSGISVGGAVLVILLTIMQAVVGLLGLLNDRNML